MEASRITAGASYITSFTLHEEFQVERLEDRGVVPQDDFDLLLDDPEGSSEESGPYTDEDAELADTGASTNPEATEEESATRQPDAGAI